MEGTSDWLSWSIPRVVEQLLWYDFGMICFIISIIRFAYSSKLVTLLKIQEDSRFAYLINRMEFHYLRLRVCEIWNTCDKSYYTPVGHNNRSSKVLGLSWYFNRLIIDRSMKDTWKDSSGLVTWR